MAEKIKTRTLPFPAKENPYMEKALFDGPIVSQYDVKAKHLLISRKFSRMRSISRDFKIGNYGRLGRLDAYTGGLGP